MTDDATPEAQDGGVIPSPEASWTPTFPAEAHSVAWVAFARVGQGVEMLSAEPLDPDDRRWLATWLSHHELRDPDESASYVYLALGADWREQRPDGSRTPRGVTGVGSGIGFGEPPGATPARVAEVVRLARELLVLEADTASTKGARTEAADHFCRVCGYRSDEPPWGDDGRSPSFDHCPCCGVEWGYQDSSTRGVERFRARWLMEDAPWRDRKVPPDGLTTGERLGRIAPRPEP